MTAITLASPKLTLLGAMEGMPMYESNRDPRPRAGTLLDQVFPGACTAAFLVLMGSLVEAACLYWR